MSNQVTTSKTTYEAIRAGFVAFALEKNRGLHRTSPKAPATQVGSLKGERPDGSLKLPGIRSGLLTAAESPTKLRAFSER